MAEAPYSLSALIGDLRRIAAATGDELAIIAQVKPLTLRLAATPGWVRPAYLRCDAVQGFGVNLLHEEADHRLAVFAMAWLPGHGIPPHNHGTWAVVAGVDGSERNVFWNRVDDGAKPGHARLVRAGDRLIALGDVLAFGSRDIHSVANESDRVTLSLHIYGKHLNHTGRSKFDPAHDREEKLIVAVQ
ncbi:MAG: hypothetical protein EXQ96_03660 [Alphaproteobacteria bacterium]|nr:hypothetical protein [Alphaproteobacteria bacterium]